MASLSGLNLGLDAFSIVSSGCILLSIEYLIRKKVIPYFSITHLSIFKNSELDDLNVSKFSKEIWKLIWHSYNCIFEFILIINSNYYKSTFNPYISNTKLFWDKDSTQLTIALRILYLIQIGYYFIGIIDYIFSFVFKKPNDLYVMLLHHFVTILLLLISYLPNNCYRVGLSILFIHEITDITLYLAKAFHYSGFNKTADILFVFAIITWIGFRLIIFPAYILSVWLYANNEWQWIPGGILLSILYILHIYWVGLMLKVLYISIKTNEKLSDPRENNNNNQNIAIELDNQTDDTINTVKSLPMLRRNSSMVSIHEEIVVGQRD